MVRGLKAGAGDDAIHEIAETTGMLAPRSFPRCAPAGIARHSVNSGERRRKRVLVQQPFLMLEEGVFEMEEIGAAYRQELGDLGRGNLVRILDSVPPCIRGTGV
jgi:hypothetical protein